MLLNEGLAQGEPNEKCPPAEARFIRGDCDGDGVVSGQVTDAIVLLNHNFSGGPAPPCLAACDADRDGEVLGRVTDAIFLLNFSFVGGPPPRVALSGLRSGASSG